MADSKTETDLKAESVKMVVTETDVIAAVGPYSLARRVGNLIFLSGQIGLGVDKMLVKGGTIAEFKQIILNLKSVLKAVGANFSNITRVVVYITDMADYAEINKVYAESFQKPYPVRTTVEVKGLPAGSHVEIEVTAVV